MMWRVGLVALLGACTGQSGEARFVTCPTASFTPIDPDDDEIGFTAEALVAALTSPASVTWAFADDEAWIGRTLPLTLSGFAVEGEVQMGDYTNESPVCALAGQRTLRVPVGLTLDLGEGQGIATGVVHVEATGVLPDAIVPYDWGPEITLTGELGAGLDTWWTEVQTTRGEWTSGFELKSVHATFGGTWNALELDIGAQHEADDYRAASMIWRGPTAP